MIMKKHIFAILIILLSFSLNAQQEAMFTHYMFNVQSVNPAYVGTQNAVYITAMNRVQWVDFQGAPLTQSLALNIPIEKQKLGIGLSVLNDKIGFVGKTYAFADISYRIKLSKKTWLSFGLKGGVNYRRVNFTNMTLDNPNDPDVAFNQTSGWLPNLGAGIYLYADKFYVGFSIPKILENDYELNTFSFSGTESGEKRHFFLIGGYIFNLSHKWKLKPSTYVKMTGSAPLQVDLTAHFLYKNKFWFGPMFRSGDAAGAMLGFYITPSISFGYSYDWSYSNTSFVSNLGSHEVFLRLKFKKDDRLCPAYDF